MASQESAGKVSLGELVIDEGTYTAKLRGRTLDLTFNGLGGVGAGAAGGHVERDRRAGVG